ncbi:hypothetical protein ABB37_00203 [Leptomonas pyrrhocoris]|uniref:FAM13A-like domain-containing protein n=1 Tax=Leptomonas pyrrhocoris TaxID=157538 RepID=A0A0M9GA07_LEPPY|nr:hypothetical protein ABB37_00203 [Leptomonas pyrrhocoris]KPA85883.1 hypothetical protein ABB37_00203 [Leptomonas pyrrhocoris]|eukprot:XP_015664322.1 hypothetical protein ABB37_00203 [Leptomonas pyrrhocoris]
MVADPLAQILTQVIDDVSFSQTHTVSEDFRVYPKSSIESVNTLQQEQRKRVEQTYGARAPSPDFLGSQLLAEYRGEAASLQLAKESGDPNFPTSISRMTSEQGRQFKKDMKQRIHEWESTVRQATGQADVFPDQKASLRSIYELYRAIKMKVLGVEQSVAPHGGGTEPSVAVREVSQSVAATAPATSSGAGGGATAAGSRGESTRDSGTVAKESSASANAAAAKPAGRPSGVAVSRASSTASVAGSTSSAVLPDWMQRIERVQLGTDDVTAMSDDALQTEKRTLKQVLHRFESDFEKFNGVRPGRHDRHGFTGEYHRYGELKNELTRRAQNK